MKSNLKAGDKVRVKFPGHWAHNRIVEVAEPACEWGLPIHYTGPGQPSVCVIGLDRVVVACLLDVVEKSQGGA
jgi:hypothetical protein